MVNVAIATRRSGSRSTAVMATGCSARTFDSRKFGAGRNHLEREQRLHPDRLPKRWRSTVRFSPGSATAGERSRARATLSRRRFGYGKTVAELGRPATMRPRPIAEPLTAMPPPRDPAIRALRPGRMGQRPHPRRKRRRADRRYRRDPARGRRPPRALFPDRLYKVTDTIPLKPDTVLIGLHPKITQLFVPDRQPGPSGRRGGATDHRAPKGGDNIVAGLGLFAGRINHRAMALMWKRGRRRLVEDVKIMGGGGTALADGKAPDHSARQRRSGRRRAGRAVSEPLGDRWRRRHFRRHLEPRHLRPGRLLRSDTQTPGHVTSSPSSIMRATIVLDHVENWEFLAPQTEQEVGEGTDAVVARDPQFAQHPDRQLSRLSRHAQHHPARIAVQLYNSSDIRFRNVHVNAESGYAMRRQMAAATYLRAGKYPFENAIEDVTRGKSVREREFAGLDVAGGPAAAPPAPCRRRSRSWQTGSSRSPAPRSTRRQALFRRASLPAHLSLERPRASRWSR